MKTLVKSVARKLLSDRAFTRIMSKRSRNHQLKYLGQTGDLELARKLVDAYGTSVLHGPFRGQVYPKASLLNRAGAPRLLGSYEQELHQIFDKLDSRYELLIDVGAADGYYAVGMARKSGRSVFAYETDPRESASCGEMARLNGVASQVECLSWCDEDEIVRLCAGHRCFVLSDCEGYEYNLFGSRAVRALDRSDLVIELHDRAGESMLDVLRERFAATHRLEALSVEPRHLEDYPEAAILGSRAEQAIGDHRPSTQQWLYCVAK